jgi:hypothetical protein
MATEVQWTANVAGSRVTISLHAYVYRCRVARLGKRGLWLSIALVIALLPVKVTNGVFVICAMYHGPVGYDKVREVTKISNYP